MKKIYILNSLLFFIILSILNTLIKCLNENIVVLPLKKIDDSFLTNSKNITEIIQFIFLESTIADLNLGYPFQRTNIIIKPGESNIYLTSSSHNKSVYDNSIKITELKYPKMYYFNNEKSKTIEYIEANSKSYFYNNFKEWKTVKDNLEINNYSQTIKLSFVLANSILYEEPGSLGLIPEEKKSVVQFTPSFLFQLKNNSLINNYKWFIYYGEKNENDYFVIGCSPHEFIIPETGKEIYPNLNYENDFYNINDQIFIDKPKMSIKFDEIYDTSNLTNLEKDESFEDNNKVSFLNINLGVIVGPTNYQNYLRDTFFKDYLYNNICYNETFEYRSTSYNYFYCKDTVYKEVKKNFKPLVFKKVDLYENFILTYNDLFLKKNGYLIFLVIFIDNYFCFWDLGAPFLRKYQFVYDFGNKQIGYYHDNFRKEKNDEDEDEDEYETSDTNKDNDNNKNGKKDTRKLFYISLIIILACLLIFLEFILVRKVYYIRKKRANELDDDYEYKDSIQ